MGLTAAVNLPWRGPSYGYAPLQRLEDGQCIALLVRRSRGAPCATLKSQARFGIPIDLPAAQPKPYSSSHVVAPISGFNPTRPANEKTIPLPIGSALPKDCFPSGFRRGSRQQLSWSFLPLRRMDPSESTPPRLASPGTFRPQGFAPSRRFPPRSDLRPYFIPVAPLGFCSTGIFPHCQVPELVAPWMPSWRYSYVPIVIKDTRPLISAHRSARHSELPPSGPCSDSESVLTF